jgi:Ion channel
VFVVATIVEIARGVATQAGVNQQSVVGAICIHLLFGIFFLFVYSAVALLDSGPFFAQGTDGTPALRLYFSFVTLTTVGYGHYTAASSLGHTLSMVEALLGQLYLVTIVAILVSRISQQDFGATLKTATARKKPCPSSCPGPVLVAGHLCQQRVSNFCRNHEVV